MFIRDNSLVLFPCSVFIGFDFGIMLASKNELKNVSWFLIFWKSLKKIGVSSSYMLVKFTSKAIRSMAFLCQDSLWFIDIISLDFLFLHDLVSVGFMFLGICSFHLGYPIYCHTIVLLIILLELVLMAPLSFLISISWVFSFSS